MLEAQGYNVIVTKNGQECIEKFDENLQINTESQDASPFDVVVVDYHLPGKDGIEVIEHILSAAPSQRVLIASSYPEDVIRKSAQMLQKAVELIQKPFDLNYFMDTVEGRRVSEVVGGHVQRKSIK
jgi:CheY-like chemotaxis protein